ncbi:ArsA family ATPase [Streptomyces aidingensis]|uniref:Arsenite-transporting ATPase n=1 Tax=Streptomyces aidingensis TaxID=910347 RepID=A0A1I1LGU2_9ACTN|nr:ArsA-related P-loop ATPase [Streptomyces aidingensis]SFC72324.1 arsenite-transporting ATPase [Streptomyces aidingensis]
MTRGAGAARTLLVTGPGGAGTTTVAAATALAQAAATGQDTLLLSAEPEARLGALLGIAALPSWPASPPLRMAPHCWVARLDPAERGRAGAAAVQEEAAGLFEALGAAPLDDGEVPDLPGTGPPALLEALHRLATGRARPPAGEDAPGAVRPGGPGSGPAGWGCAVVDMGPWGEALRAVGLPQELAPLLRRLRPAGAADRAGAPAGERAGEPAGERGEGRWPWLAQLAGLPRLPARRLAETAGRWAAALTAVGGLLAAPGTGVRLVAEPGPQATEAVRLALAGLALHGVALESVVANRLLPGGSPDSWLAGLAARQRAGLTRLMDLAAELPLHRVAHLGRPAAGVPALAGLGIPAAGRPVPAPAPEATDGALRLPLPGIRRDELQLVRHGGQLIVTAGPFRRRLPVPPGCHSRPISGAVLDGGALTVRFAG